MPTKTKIKIKDDTKLRDEIDRLYEGAEKVCLAKWSLTIAKHILKIADIDYFSIDEIMNGFKANEMWQEGKARMYDVRQAGFKVHQLARSSDNEIKRFALRTTGQAIGSGHMREHAMVASDYAIKTINLLYSNDKEAIKSERLWQLNELKKVLKCEA